MKYHSLKRLIDIIGATIGLVVLCPLLAVIAILILAQMGSPVFFRQTRPGYNGTPFNMLKFRSMRNASDSDGNLLPDADRLTTLGKFLRSTSLDELPELWNVLKGDMSLIGPRPLLNEYLPLYTPDQARRHEVRPGITGWAQVNGRNAISWDSKLALDVWYVENHSIILDLRILLLTFWKVVNREGISAAGEATMPKFEGSTANRD